MPSPLLRSWVIAPLVLLACAAAPDGAAEAPPSTAAPSATAASSEPATQPDGGSAESDAARRARLAELKHERCSVLASTIQRERAHPLLVNINDARTLIELAGELDEWADQIDRIKLSPADLSPLKELRDKYTGTTRAMARALTDTADADGYEERQAPLGRFRKLDPQRGEVLAGISEYCNAPVG
jgi:hypothetical protein